MMSLSSAIHNVTTACTFSTDLGGLYRSSGTHANDTV